MTPEVRRTATIQRLFSLEGRHALVTGATGYLGLAMARALAECGAHVHINGRKPETCEAVTATLRADGLQASAAAFDIGDGRAVSDWFEGLFGGELSVLVNNAYTGRGGGTEHVDPQDFRDSYDVAVVSAHRLFRAALPLLRRARARHGDASVINISSMYGFVSPDPSLYRPEGRNPPFYGAAKAALAQLSRYAACEFGPEGIRVNAVAPGPFPALEVQNTAPDFVAELAKKTPLERIGSAEEIKGAVAYLASPAASYTTGTTLHVDGGWTAW